MKAKTTVRTLPYYVGIGLLFLVSKYWYTLGNSEDLWFLLSPVNACIELATGSTGIYTANGFMHTGLPIIIDKSCAGFNFWLLSFSLLSLTTLHFYPTHRQKLTACLVLAATSYMVTVFVNVSRILIALLTLKHKAVHPSFSKDWMHEAQGAFVYLLFLILLYRCIYYITIKLTKTDAYTC